MSEYTITDNDVDLANDLEELLNKNEKLSNQNEILSKELREKDHQLKQSVSELKMENEILKKSNQSLEELVKTYKSTIENKSNQEDLEILANEIADLENRLFLTEQSEQNLKRNNQTLHMEISNLKIEIDKISIGTRNHNESSSSLIFKSFNQEGLENMDNDTKALLTELLNQIDELKREKIEVEEKALNMLTEKEMENMEIREHMEKLKEDYSAEINKLTGKIYNAKINGNFNDEDDNSINSDEGNILLEKYKELQDEFEEFKKDVDEKERIFIEENEKLKRELEMMENIHSNDVRDLENEISSLKTDLANKEMDRFQYEKNFNDENDNKRVLYNEIENLQSQVQHLIESKEKIALKNKEQVAQMHEELKELDSNNNSLKHQKIDIEKELNNLKSNSNKSLREFQEKNKIDIGIKEKEISQLKQRIEFINKEKDTVLKDYEVMKKLNEKLKLEYKELNENLKKIKDNHENEIRKVEDKFAIFEKKMEHEKNRLIEHNKELAAKISEYSKISKSNRNSFEAKSLELAFIEKEENKNCEYNSKIILLEDEITLLNSQIVELNSKLRQSDKFKSETEVFSKENLKLKNDLKELKEMYEKQIDDLQKKALQMANNLQQSRRATRGSLKADMSLNPKQLQLLTELENTISKLTADNKYLNDKIEILCKEIDSLKVLRENDVNFLRVELKSAENEAINAKVSLATLAFEKDNEIIKYKNMYKKLSTKLSADPQKGKK